MQVVELEVHANKHKPKRFAEHEEKWEQEGIGGTMGTCVGIIGLESIDSYNCPP